MPVRATSSRRRSGSLRLKRFEQVTRPEYRFNQIRCFASGSVRHGASECV